MIKRTHAAASIARQAKQPRHRRLTTFILALGCLLFFGGTAALAAYKNPDASAQAVDTARTLVGPQVVAQVESWFFQAQDGIRQAHYQATGDAPRLEWAAPVAPPQPAKHGLTAHPRTAANTPQLASAPTDAPADVPAQLEPGSSVSWAPFVFATNGQPVLERALEQPDPTRPYVETALVRMDLQAAQLHLVAGTQEPHSNVRAARPGVIPAADQRPERLLAAFNGGFKAANGEFGMAVNSVTLLPPIDHLATLAIYRDGSVKLGAWGSDILPTSDLVSFRQNCPLLVDGGRPTDAANSDNAALWGKTVGNRIATWRSGLGISADGRYLLYVAGDGLTVPALAQALADAGADRAMQLDINSWWARFVTYAPIAGGKHLAAQKLLTSMYGDARQFLVPDSRDFFYLTAR